MSLTPYAFQEVVCCVCGERLFKTRAKRQGATKWQHRSARMCQDIRDWTALARKR